MKKTFTLILILAFFSNELTYSQGSEEKKFPLQLSLLYPVGTGWTRSKDISYNFSLNALAGATGSVNGLEVGGLVNYNSSNVSGVQVAGIGNITRGNVHGFRAGGIFGVCESAMGLQVNGIFTVANEMQGATFSGIFNLSGNSDVAFAGIGNMNLQEMSGLQVAGIFNYTRKLKGVQLGLVNVVDSVEKGISIGLINITRYNAFRQGSVSLSDYMNTGINFKNGTRDLYNIYSAGINYIKEPLWVFGLGLGHLKEIGRHFNFQPEIIGYTYFPTDFRDIRETYTLHVKLGFNYEVNETFSITLAPSIYGALKSREGRYKVAGYQQSPISPIVSHTTSNGNTVLEAGIGFNLEVCIK